MTYAEKVANGLLASMPALQLNQTDNQGVKHTYTIQSVFDLNECYADLSVRNELTTELLCSIAQQYEEMMCSWKPSIKK